MSFVSFAVLGQELISRYRTCLKRLLSKRQKNGFQDQLLLNACQKYCRMLQGEHSAILWTFIKLPSVIKFFVLSFFEWLLKTGFTVTEAVDIYMSHDIRFCYFLNRRVVEASTRLCNHTVSPEPSRLACWFMCREILEI